MQTQVPCVTYTALQTLIAKLSRDGIVFLEKQQKIEEGKKKAAAEAANKAAEAGNKTAEAANKAAAPEAAGNTTNGAQPAAPAGANPGAQV
jgi:hypothetical protein